MRNNNILKEGANWWKIFADRIVKEASNKAIENGCDEVLVNNLIANSNIHVINDNDKCILVDDNDIICQIPTKTTNVNDLVDMSINGISNWITTILNKNMNENRKIINLSETDFKTILKETAKQLISIEDAKRQGFAVPDEDLQWNEGEFKEPEKKAIGYKVFGIKNGDTSNLYPPVVANPNGEPTPIGEWIPCSAPPIVGYTVKEHRPQVKTGGQGTMRDLGNLAFRPGWHLGVVPFAPQFLYRNGNADKLMVDGCYVMPSNLVFAECEYQCDTDLSDESYKRGLTNKGKYQHSRAGIPRIPKNAFYRYRTNPDPSSADWIITGAIKVNRILSVDEVNAINEKAGIPKIICASAKEVKELKKSLKTNKNMNENKKQIKLTEPEFKALIKESVYKILKEHDLMPVDNLNMPVIIVGGDLQGKYTVNDIINNFDVTGYVEPSNHIRRQLIGCPRIRGYHGPMWDGNRIRYESPEMYDSLSI